MPLVQLSLSDLVELAAAEVVEEAVEVVEEAVEVVEEAVEEWDVRE